MKSPSFILILLVIGFMSCLVLGQDSAEPMGPPKPAPELQKFNRLVGNFEGSGTASMVPGAPAGGWTSQTTNKWILGGHFLQEDTRVDIASMGEMKMPPMFFRSFYGWDHEAKKFVFYSIGNSGELESATHLSWIDDTMVSISTTMKDGVPTINRGVTMYTDDGCTFEMQVAAGASEFRTFIKGTLKRGGPGFTLGAEEMKQGGMMPTSEQMKKIKAICGSYTMKGQMVMKPGTPAMPISASESIEAIFGGSVLQMHVHGDPIGDEGGFAYEGLAYIAWNPQKKCYSEVWLSNMGESMETELHWANKNQLVSATAGVQHGQPQAVRATLHLSDTGAIQSASMERMSSTHKMEKAFVGEYVRKDKE